MPVDAATAARNVAIILAISAGVYFLPGGGTTAAVVSTVLGVGFAAALCWVAVMLYRRHRSDLNLLGDRGRLMLYGAVGALVIAIVGAGVMLKTAPGAVVWVGLLGGAIYVLMVLWRRRGLA